MSKLVVDNDGTIRFIYSDDLRGLLEEGRASIVRVSTVEPTRDNQWEANLDMAPMFGPVLGPFDNRQDALAAEVSWLETNRL